MFQVVFRINLLPGNAGMRKPRGQGLIEYALIVLLVIVVVIGVLALLGGGVDEMYQSIKNALP